MCICTFSVIHLARLAYISDLADNEEMESLKRPRCTLSERRPGGRGRERERETYDSTRHFNPNQTIKRRSNEHGP